MSKKDQSPAPAAEEQQSQETPSAAAVVETMKKEEGVLYLGIVPTALAFTTWGYALARMPAGRLGVSTYIVPPLVVLFAWIVLGEIPAILAVVGGAVCLLGVAVSRRRSHPPAAPPAPVAAPPAAT